MGNSWLSSCCGSQAAAGINSSAADMALWLKYCLSNSKALSLTQKPQGLFEPEGFLEKVRIPAWSIYAHETPFTNYGLGWMMYALDNKQVFFHTGLSAGMQSILAVIPEEELGIVILTNEMGHLGTACLLNLLMDHLLQREKTDWHQKGHAVMSEINLRVTQETAALENERLKDSPPTLKMGAYTGEYVHPAYGSIIVGIANGNLTIKFLFNQEEGILNHWQENQFRITGMLFAPLLPWLVTFDISKDQSKAINLKLPNLGNFKRIDKI